MITCAITKVEAITGLIPSLRWGVKIRFDIGGPIQKVFVSRWLGEIAFMRQPEAENSLSPPGPNKLVLPALWESEPEHSRLWSTQEYMMQFRCDMGGDILDGIERFRDGGRLHARVQGKFQVLCFGEGDTPEEMLYALREAYTSRSRVLWVDVWGASLELTRDTWGGDLLAKLRPPGQVIFEAAIPPATATEDHGRRALEHLEFAQKAFDEGRYDETLRTAHKAGEALQNLNSRVVARYGENVQKALSNQISALHRICHIERHDQEHASARPAVDRALAQHVLVSMKTLAATYLSA